MNDLSSELNTLKIGCFVGNKCVNNIMYADDICCIAPCINGLQKLIDVCLNYASFHNIVFNCSKTKAMFFPTRFFDLPKEPNVTIYNKPIEFVHKIKYLGFTIESDLSDNCDIKTRVRSIYCIANMLRSKFFKCSTGVKNILFRYFCSSMYGCNLWCSYLSSSLNHIRVAYNNAFRILHNLPRKIHINAIMVQNNIPTFFSLLRKQSANFIRRCILSPNSYIKQIFSSSCYTSSKFFDHFTQLHYG